MGYTITKQGNICFQCFEHVWGYHIFVENLDRPLKVKIFFFKGCLVYGICQKRIGNAKRMCQKLNWSNLTGPSNSRKYRLTIKNMRTRLYSLSLTYISFNCSARLSQINLIFGTFFSHCHYTSSLHPFFSITLRGGSNFQMSSQ